MANGDYRVKTVLFVCVRNAGRSQMAEAFFNRFVGDRARAFSAGTEPADAVGSTVIEAMREVDSDLGRLRPKALTPEMLEGADKIVTMGCDVAKMCPATTPGVEDWALEDPKGKSLEKVREIRDEIKAHVLEMVRGLDD